ncbi:MAG: SDR family oxidoreductase [Hyphomicrobiaceae bacterium]|jgi:NAD(P)-dependent dehydrogenase (short-subunit alcohol dehydrogenase family)
MADVLIITGASRGIGAATARLAGARGWAVAVNYNASAAAAEQVVRDIEATGGRAIAVKADVSTEAGAVHLFAEVDRRLGRVKGLFNNAGTVHVAKPLQEMTADEADALWRTNITSQILCAREAAKRMSTRSGGPGGAIVNMSSAAAYIGGGGGLLMYAASKGAIDTLTRGMSSELSPQGIRVNGVRPGLIETTIHDATGVENRIQKLLPSVPMGRSGQPEEVGEAVLWLLSDAASYVTNTFVDIGGGR